MYPRLYSLQFNSTEVRQQYLVRAFPKSLEGILFEVSFPVNKISRLQSVDCEFFISLPWNVV